jgi:hypothetical protein
MKHVLSIALVVVTAGQATIVKADTGAQLLELLRSPGQCKGNAPSLDLKFSFGAEQLVLNAEADAIRSKMGLARSKLELAAQVRDRSGPDIFERTMDELEAQLQQKATQRFEIDDAALSAGCLDLADKGYRAILEEYNRPGDQAIRDRAKVGIDDVRAKR